MLERANDIGKVSLFYKIQKGIFYKNLKKRGLPSSMSSIVGAISMSRWTVTMFNEQISPLFGHIDQMLLMAHELEDREVNLYPLLTI